MELPRRMPNSNAHRQILGEFYDINKNKQWFHRAELNELNANHMKPTIEIYCSYAPVLEMKDILQFCGKHNVAHEIFAASHQG